MSEREERRRQREHEQARERAIQQISAQLNASAAKGVSERGRIGKAALAKIESGRWFTLINLDCTIYIIHLDSHF